MPWLDCHDLDSAVASLAEALAIGAGEVSAALMGYDESRFDDHSEDPYLRMPREVLATLGRDVDAVHLDGAFYFHGTRVLDPDEFRRYGILPLDQMVERIWSTLFELVRDERDADEWAVFRRLVESGGSGHDARLYRLKTGDRLHFGPHALLVREIFFDPAATGSHDYLGCPEIVQDIARCYRAVYGIDLEERVCSAAVPVIVKFRTSDVWPGSLRTALWYAYSMVRDGELTTNANGGFNGEGSAVPPHDVAEVEIVAASS